MVGKTKSGKVSTLVVITVFLTVALITIVLLNKYSSYSSRSSSRSPLPEPRKPRREAKIPTEPFESNKETQLPTLTPKEKEIISQLENHVVVIENQSFSPGESTIKVYDQVEWQNKDKETYQIKGEDWGNIPIEPGESFTQAFAAPGTYPYSCALHSDLTGTIVVK